MVRKLSSRYLLLLIAVGSLCFTPRGAGAQSPTSPEAVALFDEGTAHFEAGRFEPACEALKKSAALEAAINTYYQLGRCSEELKRFATAKQAFQKAAEMAKVAGDGKRERFAKRRIAEIEGKIAKLKLSLPDGIAGLTVAIDGERVPKQQAETELEIDSGSHTITVAAPGMEPWSGQIKAPESAGLVEVRVPPLKPASTGSSAAGGGAPGPDSAEEYTGPTERRNPTVFKLGIGLTIGGGAAIIGAIVGGAAVQDFCADGCNDWHPGFIALGLAGVGALGAGIPLMIVFGKQVPVESPPAAAAGAAEPDSDQPAEPGDDQPAEPAAGALLIIEPLLAPAYAGLRLRF